MTKMVRRMALLLLGLTTLLLFGPWRPRRRSGRRRRREERRQVSWYTSTQSRPRTSSPKCSKAQTGVKVELFRSGGSAIISRFLQEQQAGRIAVDVLTTSDPAAAASMTKKGIFVPFLPAGSEKCLIAPKTQPAPMSRSASYVTLFVRTDKVPAAHRPQDLERRDRPQIQRPTGDERPLFHFPATDGDRLAVEEAWLGILRKAAQNDIMIVEGNQQVVDNLKRGERLIAVGALDSYAADARKEDIPSPRSIDRGKFHYSLAHVGHKRLAESERSQALRRIYAERSRARSYFRKTAAMRPARMFLHRRAIQNSPT